MPNNFGFGLCIFRSRPKQRAGKKSVWKRSTLISGCVIFYTFKYFIGNQYPRKTTLIFIPDESSLPSEEHRNQPQSFEIKSIGSRPLIGYWLTLSDHVTWILVSDWLTLITWPGYWPLIGSDVCVKHCMQVYTRNIGDIAPCSGVWHSAPVTSESRTSWCRGAEWWRRWVMWSWKCILQCCWKISETLGSGDCNKQFHRYKLKLKTLNQIPSLRVSIVTVI